MNPLNKLAGWLDVRIGHRAAMAELRAARLPGGASMSYNCAIRVSSYSTAGGRWRASAASK